jgi:hypothetical protein
MTDGKILQAILDGQTKIREDIKKVDKKIDKVEIKLTGRLDKIGLQLANLEDDTPANEDFDNLTKRVEKVEKRFASV